MMLTVRAAANASAAPRATTRGPSPASVVSIAVTAVLPVHIGGIPVISYHTVRLRVARGFCALPDPGEIGVGLPRTREQFLHPMRRIRHRVSYERQRRCEPNTGPRTNFRAQNTLRALKRRCGTSVVRLVLEGATQHGVIQRRVVQVR